MCKTCDQKFVHLHVHSEYSLLDGLSRLDHLAQRAVDLGQPAMALTDHGAMYGTIDFYRACKKVGVKPIIGMEGYVAARGMMDRDSQLDRNRFHILHLAKNQAGFLNLLQHATESQLKGYYYKPRVDHDFMAAHSEGLISTTGCMAGEIPRALGDGNFKLADELMGKYLDIYGKENFFVELQEHDIPELSTINQELIKMAGRFGLEKNFLATNDVHYTTKEEGDPHEVLLCIQTGSTTQNPKLTLSNKEYYIKSYDEMWSLFKDYPEDVMHNAFENSLRITEMCDVDLEPQGYHLPIFDVPEGFSAASYLRHLCELGMKWRYGDDRAANDEVLHNRLNHELNIIGSMGFDTYFLIVWDLCEFSGRSRKWWDQFGAEFYPGMTYEQWASDDIWWNTRGSAAGSIVAYTLGITGIDPISNQLIFERFLNPGRVSMPDIDLDYPDDRRHEMVEYTMRRYGAEKVAQIITFGTMKARAAVRDVGRAMDWSLERVDQIAKMIPAIPGKKVKIENLFDPDHEFHNKEFIELYSRDSEAARLIDTAKQLEGVSRHASSHAAGVIIADKPLVEYVPLNRPTSGEAGLGGIDRVTQWPMEVVESMGLLKVDFLGLSTLTVLRTAVQLIEDRYGTKYEMDTIPYDHDHIGPDPSKDPMEMFRIMERGDVGGIFQIDGGGFRRMIMEMKPQRYDHIVAAVALYRPGPMDNIPEYIRRMHSDIFEGKDIVEYHTPDIKDALQDTYGIIVYQEQIIRIATDIAGYEPGEADMIRKAVAKKKEKLMQEHHVKFSAGALARGQTQEVIDAIWDDIKFFARYGFPKGHAASYGKITCQTAFLKAHYPVEYITALLSVEREKTEKVTRYLAEAKRMGLEVLPPAINSARVRFTIEDQDDGKAIIRFGFGAIKNAGEAALQLVIDERDANGPYEDIYELAERVDLRKVGSRAVEAMIKVGVFDGWGDRVVFLEAMKGIIGYSGRHHDEQASAQISLFSMFAEPSPSAKPDLLKPVDKNKYTDREVLDWEKELIGVYLSEHPLEKKLVTMQGRIKHNSAEIQPTMAGRNTTIGGMISNIRTLTTKKGDAMAIGTLEDLEGSIDIVFFPRTWAELKEKAQINQIALVGGKVNSRGGDDVSIIVDNLQVTFFNASAAEDADDVTVQQPSLNDHVISQEVEEVEEVGTVEEVEEGKSGKWKVESGRSDSPSPHPPVAVSFPEPEAPSTDDEMPPMPDFGELDREFEAMTVPAKNDSSANGNGSSADQPAAVNGNGASNGNGKSAEIKPNDNPKIAEPSTQYATPVRQAQDRRNTPRRIIIELEPSGNWRAAVRSSVRLANDYAGQDQLVVKLIGDGMTMRFPNRKTDYCDDLERSLKQVPGVLRVVAEA